MERHILIVDDDADVLAGLAALLGQLEWEVTTASSGREGLREFERASPDVVLLDVMMPDLTGIEVLEQLKAHSETTPVIMMSGAGNVDVAVQAMRLGAEHFVAKPCDVDNLEIVLEQALKALGTRRALAALRRSVAADRTAYIGSSPEVTRVNELIRKIAPAPSPVLLQGETGSGKGVVARAIHDLSPRSSFPFVDLNCAGLSKDLLESELFGHEKGAFTGAHAMKAGLLETASGGTLFLDEIGELEISLQSRLLKVLEEKKFRHVGGVRDLKVDVRLIAATNRDLSREVAEGRFRADLYYRLNVVAITLPPLRKRLADLPALTSVILERLAPDLGLRSVSLSDHALRRLGEHSWPGNIRELRNVLERAMLVCDGKQITTADLLMDTREQDAGHALPGETQQDIRPLDDVISEYVRASVEKAGGNVRKAARMLQISPSTLYSKIKNTSS